ncbi:unnamed protein product [Pleuronectes platessa]|uniref:Uncharacterized protein n=1 Tax=Pleuronectes platessa TaxID=8262 RepID=A0A9N7V4V0_PLEPL|nr:unnamed protein product [Pleuronectes platessa]
MLNVCTSWAAAAVVWSGAISRRSIHALGLQGAVVLGARYQAQRTLRRALTTQRVIASSHKGSIAQERLADSCGSGPATVGSRSPGAPFHPPGDTCTGHKSHRSPILRGHEQRKREERDVVQNCGPDRERQWCRGAVTPLSVSSSPSPPLFLSLYPLPPVFVTQPPPPPPAAQVEALQLEERRQRR